MEPRDRFEKHALSLGRIVGNLQTIEMGARMAIARLDPRAAEQIRVVLPGVRTGDWVDIDIYSDGSDLRQVLERYNKNVPAECRVQIKPIVELRDAIAHGRTFGIGPVGESNLRLLKFGKKPRDNKVEVVLAIEMSETWFTESLKLLGEAANRVRIALDYESREL